jgi:hypothetical protein
MTGVRISSFKVTDLRPASVRSLLEKRIMTASTPLIRYYDHLRFVYEVESRMRELKRSTDSEQQSQPSTKNKPQSTAPAPNGTSGPGGEGQTHRKDGGSRLNPNDAPQQTVNPPAQMWSDTVVARLEPRPDTQSGILDAFQEINLKSKGFPTQREASGAMGTELVPTDSIAAGSIATHVLAMPKRSPSCVA